MDNIALGSLVWWLATLHIAGGWNSMIIVVLSNPGHYKGLYMEYYVIIRLSVFLTDSLNLGEV